MNLLGITIVIVCCAVRSIDSSPSGQREVEDKVCTDTEYEVSGKCIEDTRRQREKQETKAPCEVNAVEPVVQTVRPFEMLIPVEPLKVVRQPALKQLDRTIILQADTADEDPEEFDKTVHYRVLANDTPIRRLVEIVNSTNHIHMPTTLNNTNVNNVHLYRNLTEDGLTKDEADCCTAVRPRSCHTTSQGVRCKHRRFRVCGPQCTAPIVHVQKRMRCHQSTGACEEKVAYVPQPTTPPTCVYIEQWPFVVCGKVTNMSVICAGCYDHYGHGYEAYGSRFTMQQQCIGCYDDAFDTGPLYRRGPVLRPFHYHQPPCYLIGDCPEAFDDCGYGCYGHDLIDPVWGESGGPSAMDPAMDDDNIVYVSDVLELSNGTSNDWGVPVSKCAVVTDGDTVTVRNCTNDVDNRYLAASAQYPY
ncbi:uncharacterized protein LOC131214645 [Anopheles bellator]|uniref:uncharacterized protein LOC131214644 n=1 Tax=Anopheles bellator TaxID=139047 RepID=UPI002649E174|nr:uncharacterized protein LOC131214644 [Anopheles bellator]XP_058064965.1 uncharacterized protein LOC131214645 [Anopheles bellator]